MMPPMLPRSILILLLLFPAVARADDEVLRCAQTLMDLGAISDDQPRLHAFSFVNTSPRTVSLEMTYCHFCTPPALDKSVIGPGQNGTVVLEINPAGQRGRIQASATIFEAGRPASAITVELRADVCPRVWVEPTSMFPRIVRDAGAVASFTVTGRSKGFKVLRIDADPPIESADIGEPGDIEDCGSTARIVPVTIRFRKDLPLGPWGSRIKVITTDTEATPRVIIADGEVVGRLSFEPANIAVRLAPGAPFSRTFELVSDQTLGGPILLDTLDVVSRDEASSIALDAQPTVNPARIRVTVSGVAPLRARESARITLQAVARTLGSSESETLTIPITLVVTETTRKFLD